MVKKEYKLGESTFNTKKACEDYVRGVLMNLGCVRIGAGHDKWAFFNALINNHPDNEFKMGSGIDYYWIRKNQIGQGLETMIKRTDGTVADFSWRYCCQFKPRTIEENITRAMRTALTEYITEFKLKFNNNFKCTLCAREGTDSTVFHADHVVPFHVIKDEFLTREQSIPTRCADTAKGATRFHEDDHDFERRWVEFHHGKAKLQILCRS